MVAGRATCTTGSAPASAPATDSINRSYRFSPAVSLLLSRCQRRSPQLLRSLFPPPSLFLVLFLFLAPLRFFFALPLRDEAGKKGNDMEKIRYESGEHRKKWHRGRKRITKAKRKKKRASETMRPPMEILVGSPFIYFAALPDFLL